MNPAIRLWHRLRYHHVLHLDGAPSLGARYIWERCSECARPYVTRTTWRGPS